MRAYDGIKAERGRQVPLETPDFLERARNLLARSISIEIRMSGGSMRPAIEDGDIITIEPLDEGPLKTGDIILYQSQQETAVIHRVVRVDYSSVERTVVTRGDAASQPDVPIPITRILGRVRHVERAGQRVSHRMVRRRSGFWIKLTALLRRLTQRRRH